VTGGHIKMRDYFSHCLDHPRLDPYVCFTPDSIPRGGGPWGDIPADRMVDDLTNDCDAYFLGGVDWRFFHGDGGGRPVVNLIQHVRHGDPSDERFAYLDRKAFRICVSPEVREAIAPRANGPFTLIKNGVPLDLFRNGENKAPRSVVICALKNPRLGLRLQAALRAEGLDAALIAQSVPRAEFAAMLRRSEVFVGLPNRTEGFYLPALEAMAAGCAVVCADAVGNRGFCFHDRTCLMPGFDDPAGHVKMVLSLAGDEFLRKRLRREASPIAVSHTMEAERDGFYRFLKENSIV